MEAAMEGLLGVHKKEILNIELTQDLNLLKTLSICSMINTLSNISEEQIHLMPSLMVPSFFLTLCRVRAANP